MWFINRLLPGPDPKSYLAGKVVLITGASSGIGRQLAIDMVTHGAQVILAARRIDVLLELRQELNE